MKNISYDSQSWAEILHEMGCKTLIHTVAFHHHYHSYQSFYQIKINVVTIRTPYESCSCVGI
jgi:alpha-L-fucosidase